MTLQDWLNSFWIAEHETTAVEIRELLGLCDRDLARCRLPGVDEDCRLMSGYNAALQIAIAALAVAGYRVRSEAHHFRALQSLKYTLAVENSTIHALEGFRKRRNVSLYKRANTVSTKEADEMVALAVEVRSKFLEWLERNHSELSPERCGA